MDQLIKNFKKLKLEANPHYYDYLNRLTLKSDKTFEYIRGDGQCVRYIMNKIEFGKFQFLYNKGQIRKYYSKQF